jgi:osmotically inducible protein OsmC
MKVKYTAHATASHGGRGVGNAATDDGKVSVKFSQPKAMGGDDGPGTNPEQLLGLAYSACFLGAMGAAARRAKKTLPEESTVTAAVSFVDREDNVGFTMQVALEAHVPGWEKADVESTMTAAHDICPISHLIRNKHEVAFSVV